MKGEAVVFVALASLSLACGRLKGPADARTPRDAATTADARDAAPADRSDATDAGQTERPDVADGVVEVPAPDAATFEARSGVDGCVALESDAGVDAPMDVVYTMQHPGDPCVSGEVPGLSYCGAGVTCLSGTCAACGTENQPCCQYDNDSYCGDGLSCATTPSCGEGRCVRGCGVQGGACCPGGYCQSGSACTTHDATGTCEACGSSGQLCCPVLPYCHETGATCDGTSHRCQSP